MTFLLKFSVSFFLLAIIATLGSGNEMLGFAIYGSLMYLLASAPIWLLINLLIKSESVVFLIIKYFLGLTFFNLLFYLVDGAVITFALFGKGDKYSNWGVSLGLHIVFTVAYIVGTVNFETDKRSSIN